MTPHLMICTPAFGRQVIVPYVNALVQTIMGLAELGAKVGLCLRGGIPLVHLARSLFAAEFLAEENATHLMFIDADIEFRPDDVLRLLAHNVPLIGATYRIKTPDVQFALGAMPGDSRMIESSGLCRIEVNSLPGGFMLIQRQVFERLIEAYPESKIDEMCVVGHPAPIEMLYDFFPSGLVGGVHEPEDFGFCRLWRAVGGQVWLDPTIVLTHYGMQGLTADPMQHLLSRVNAADAAAPEAA